MSTFRLETTPPRHTKQKRLKNVHNDTTGLLAQRSNRALSCMGRAGAEAWAEVIIIAASKHMPKYRSSSRIVQESRHQKLLLLLLLLMFVVLFLRRRRQ